MSELCIELTEVSVTIDDGQDGDPHVVITTGGAELRIEAADVRRLADVLVGASVMVEPEPLSRSQWLAKWKLATIDGRR